MKSERALQNYLITQATARGIYARKTVTPGRSGFPDVMLAYKGRVVFVELKTPLGGGKLSKLQVREIARMSDAGLDVRVYETVEDVDALIETLAG